MNLMAIISFMGERESFMGKSTGDRGLTGASEAWRSHKRSKTAYRSNTTSLVIKKLLKRLISCTLTRHISASLRA
jgi:hypothetical protein